MHRWLFFALAVLLTPELQAQDNAVVPAGRLDQIHEQRVKKAETLKGWYQAAIEENSSRVGRTLRLERRNTSPER